MAAGTPTVYPPVTEIPLEEAFNEGDKPLIELIGERGMAIVDAMVGHTDEDEHELSEGEDPLTAGSSHPPASPQPQWRKERPQKMQQVGGEEDGRRSSMASDESAQTYLKMPQQMLLTGVLCKEHSTPKENTPCRYFFKLKNNGGCKQGENCSCGMGF